MIPLDLRWDYLKLNYPPPHTIGFTTVTGLGTEHSLSVDNELAITRGLITIDNVIQSPLSRKEISVSLSNAVGAAQLNSCE